MSDKPTNIISDVFLHNHINLLFSDMNMRQFVELYLYLLMKSVCIQSRMLPFLKLIPYTYIQPDIAWRQDVFVSGHPLKTEQSQLLLQSSAFQQNTGLTLIRNAFTLSFIALNGCNSHTFLE